MMTAIKLIAVMLTKYYNSINDTNNTGSKNNTINNSNSNKISTMIMVLVQYNSNHYDANLIINSHNAHGNNISSDDDCISRKLKSFHSCVSAYVITYILLS